MKEMARYGITLAVICIAASGLLAAVNAATKPRIDAQAAAEERASLKEVMPEAADFKPVEKDGVVYYYRGLDKAGNVIGIVFKASAKGYSSEIEAVAGVLKDGSISAVKVINENETPGIGSKVRQESFTGQFKNKNAENISEVQAITGATISSSAVINSVTEKFKEILPELKDGK